MTISEVFVKHGLNQAAIARLIARSEEVEPKLRVRAHRLFHGALQPTAEEVAIFYAATKGGIDGNTFYGIFPSKRTTKTKNS